MRNNLAALTVLLLTATATAAVTAPSEAVDENDGREHFSAAQALASAGSSREWAESFRHMQLAAQHGHPAAQHALAAAYSTGLYHGLRVPMDPGRSLAVDYFSALAGHPEAHMSMGHRYLKGLGVPQSCEKAAVYYEFAANHAAEQLSARGHAARPLHAQLTNHIPWLSDDDNEAELIEYYDRMAQEGDVRSIHTLGMLYMQGSLHTDQDLHKAAKYFELGAGASFAASSGKFGMMLARGIGVPADAGRAVSILKEASRQGDPTAVLGLGYCYQHGLGLDVNLSAALELYQSVTNKHEEAGFFVAELILGSSDSHALEVAKAVGPNVELSGKRKDSQLLTVAQQFYLQSANRGHVMSMHRVGHISLAQRIGQPCAIAMNFKNVAEAGDWAHRSTLAHRCYNDGDMSGALQLFSELAFEGYESAQMNAAFILSKMYCPETLQQSAELIDGFSGSEVSLTAQSTEMGREQTSTKTYGAFYVADQLRANKEPGSGGEERSYTAMHTGHDGGFATIPHEDAMQCEQRALALYANSAHQGSGAAYLKVGDFHYYGLGGLPRDKGEAARYYQIAADLKNTHALFNLGIMHQTGDGVLKDFHLAKRFYDEAAVYDSAAKTPSTLAVGILRLHELLFSLLGETVASDLLSELSGLVLGVEGMLGLGFFIFVARSHLLRAWMAVNKSVLISSSSRFESSAYSSATSLIDVVSSRIEGYKLVLRHAFRRSHLKQLFRSVFSGGDEPPRRSEGVRIWHLEDWLNADAISSLLFFFSVALFMVVLRYRSARRRRRGGGGID